MNKKMDNKIELKIDTETKNKLRKFAFENNMSLAATTRIAITKFFNACDKDKIFNKDLKFKQELIYELRRFGNNLNQIAHKLNIALKTEDVSASEKIVVNQSIQQIDQLSTDIKNIHALMDKRL